MMLRFHKGRCHRWLTSGVWLIAIFFLTTQSAVLGHSDCLKCELFNRLPKPDVQCAKNNFDCGGCNSGYIPDPQDEHGICLELKMVSRSVNVTTDSGSGVYLPCTLNTEVNCMWTRDGKKVRIDFPKYEWDVGKGIDTDDCSIFIFDLSETDAGTWLCSNAGHPMNTVVSLAHRITVQPRPTYNVSAGEPFTIECRFRHTTNCRWYKEKREINEANDRFIFKETATGCSLTIHSFNLNADQGNWTCFIHEDLYPEDTILFHTILLRGHQESQSENVTSVDHSANVTSIDHRANVTSVYHSAIVTSIDHSIIVTSVSHSANVTSVDHNADVTSINNNADVTSINDNADVTSVKNNEKTSVSGAPPSVPTLPSLHSSYPLLMVNIYIIDVAGIGFLFYYYWTKRRKLHAAKSKET